MPSSRRPSPRKGIYAGWLPKRGTSVFYYLGLATPLHRIVQHTVKIQDLDRCKYIATPIMRMTPEKLYSLHRRQELMKRP